MPVNPNPCPVGGVYKGDLPESADKNRPMIWKWAKENTDFKDLNETRKAINDHFFGGRAPDKWITDIIAGRKTPFKSVAADIWRKTYDRQLAVRQAQELNRYAGTSSAARVARGLFNVARTVETIGHAIVFPISHGGDLLYRPSSWYQFVEGIGRTYGRAYNANFNIAKNAEMQRDPMFNLFLQGGGEAGPKSKAVGILSEPSLVMQKMGQLPVLRNFVGAADRAWQGLGQMRFELWKKAMLKNSTFRMEGGKLVPNMSDAQLLDYSREFAEWANDATGAGEGRIANIGGDYFFGPKLTQSKINRVAQTGKTVLDFANWKNLSPGEKAVAWTRLSGFSQYAVTRLGFLAANAGLLSWLGSKQKINVTDPNRGDYLQFKGVGLEGSLPGLGSEIRALARVMALTYYEFVPDSTKRQLAAKFGATLAQKPREAGVKAVYDIAKDYGSGKLNPGLERAAELVSGRAWDNALLPWNPRKPGPGEKKVGIGQYLSSIGPIPLQGPIKYFYDNVKKAGGSALDSLQATKGLIILGLGVTGAHVREDTPPKQKTHGKGVGAYYIP